MTSHIVTHPENNMFVAGDDHAGIVHPPQKVVARPGNLLCASRAKPHVEMDRIHFPLKPFSVSVVTLRKRAGIRNFERWTSVGIRFGHNWPCQFTWQVSGSEP